MKKLKIRFVSFEIAKFGGIISQWESRIQAFKNLGHDVDIIILKYDKNVNESQYKKKLAEMESGYFMEKVESHSQNGGMEKSPVLGYYRNSYYGFLLPPKTNAIPVFHENSLDFWHEAVDDVDILIWSFMPTKTSEAKDFDYWWKFFDLPSNVKQIMTVHDAYFDKRTSWVKELKEKILFLDCCQITCYNACENIEMKRALFLNWRIFPDKMFERSLSDRDVDFFSAHIFKSMKKMEDLLRAIPYLQKKHTVMIGGSGIEYSYMTSKDKVKESYLCSKKKDPDLLNGIEETRLSVWDRSLEYNMEYIGMLSSSEMNMMYQNSKFMIDPSWSKHYANYCRTHINGFTIEGVIQGCYPILRDYDGLVSEKSQDDIFDNINAIIIPWDATPKQFAGFMKKALTMSDSEYLKATRENFELFKNIFSAEQNAKEQIKLLFDKKELQILEIGVDTELVTNQSKDVMNNFFGIELPIKWETK